MGTDLTGKVALVTGGASGIGAATAERLAKEGCRVVIADLQDDLGRAQAEAVDGRYVRLDVAQAGAWGPAIAGIADNEGRIDVVHLNAGVTTGAPDFLELTDEQYDRIIGVNVDGVVYGTRAAARAMAAQGGGAIVATASVAGLMGFVPDPVYTLTKHAVVGLVRALGPSLAARGITLNAVCPGVVDTPLVGDVRAFLEQAGYPMMPPAQIADGVVAAISSGRSGECWVCLPGRDAEVFEFSTVVIPGLV